MNYQEADAKLQGRCAQRRKLQRNTYLERVNSYWNGSYWNGKYVNAIAVKLHATNVLTFHRSGRITVRTGGWDTMVTRDRINSYLPAPYSVSSHRGSTMLYRVGPNYEWTPLRVVSGEVVIMPSGKIRGGKDVQAYLEEIRQRDNEAARAGNRARYWMRKARGIYTDTSNCAARRDRRRWNCGTAGRFNRQTLTVGQYQCGCRVYHKAPNARNLTVEKILAEDNASVRVAMMNVYGIERFFLDAKANVLDEQAGYQLLSLRLSNWADIRALKMTCPSTGAVYVNTVPPNDGTVSQALDWMFNTTDYLGTVSQQA